MHLLASSKAETTFPCTTWSRTKHRRRFVGQRSDRVSCRQRSCNFAEYEELELLSRTAEFRSMALPRSVFTRALSATLLLWFDPLRSENPCVRVPQIPIARS